MARLFMDGFETGKFTQASNSDAGDFLDSMWQVAKHTDLGLSTSISFNDTTTYESGDYSLNIQFNSVVTNDQYQNCVYRQLPSTYNKLYTRFNFLLENATYSQNISVYSHDDTTYKGTTLSMQIYVNTNSGDLLLVVNGSTVATVTNAFNPSTWYLFEVLYDYTGSNIIVRIDNTNLIDYSGTIDSAIKYAILGKSDTTQRDDFYSYYIDDFAINDDSGSVNNSWIGAGVIRLIKPTSDDTNTDFTPSTGSDHYALVDDFPDDGDTTYNSSTVSGDIDTFGLESVPSVATGQTINAIQAVYRARSEIDVSKIAPILISGVTTDTGASVTTNLSDYQKTLDKVYDVDPNTLAQWTEANVNALKGGYKNAT